MSRRTDTRASRRTSRRWWRRVTPYFRPYRARMARQMALSVGLGLLVAALPWPTKIAIDNVLGDRPLSGWLARFEPLRTDSSALTLLIVLAGISVVLIVIQVSLRTAQAVGRRTIAAEAGRDLGVDLFDIAQQRIQIGSADAMTGDVIRRITFDARASVSTLVVLVLGIWTSIISLVSILAVTAAINWRLVAYALAGAAPLLAVSFMKAQSLRRLSMTASDVDGRITTAIERDLATIIETQLLAAEERADRDQPDPEDQHRQQQFRQREGAARADPAPRRADRADMQATGGHRTTTPV